MIKKVPQITNFDEENPTRPMFTDLIKSSIREFWRFRTQTGLATDCRTQQSMFSRGYSIDIKSFCNVMHMLKTGVLMWQLKIYTN